MIISIDSIVVVVIRDKLGKIVDHHMKIARWMASLSSTLKSYSWQDLLKIKTSPS
jgi:hypothetical protein